MAITYTWTFSQLDCYLSKDAKTDVVFDVHWRLQGVEGDYSEELYGSESIDTSDLSNFVEFANLKQSDVEGWMDTDLDVASLKENIANSIEIKKNPTTEAKSPPW
jgi:hypothetical protein